jgi:hypothetical protein
MNGVRVKPGADCSVIAPAGFRLLGALDRTARRLQVDLTITCGCDAHPPTDPHTLGEAYDVRTHGFDPATTVRILRDVMLDLADDDNPMDAPTEVSGGLATMRFFGWLEHAGAPTEHLHFQRRQGTVYA